MPIMIRLPIACWPIIAAVLASSSSGALLWHGLGAESALHAAIDARLTADSQRRASIIGEVVAEFREGTARLAQSHEIRAYIANKALGMSLRYGLLANLDAIGGSFGRAMDQGSSGAGPHYDRLLLVDDDGLAVVNVARVKGARDVVLPGATDQTLVIDFDQRFIIDMEPIPGNGAAKYHVVAVADLFSLATNLMSSDASSGYREAAVSHDGREIPTAAGALRLSSAEALTLADIPENRVLPISPDNGGPVAVRTGLRGAPLSLVTVMDQELVYGSAVSGKVSAVLAAIPIVVLIGGFGIEAQRRKASMLLGLVQHDRLTGLPNRTLLVVRLQHSLDRTHRSGDRGAILFIDLDRFKAVNDSLGHAVGDELLKAVSKRMLTRIRSTDTLARHGGDEFVLLLDSVSKPEEAGAIAQEIINLVAEPFILSGGHTVHIGCSIGITLFPDQGTDADQLVEHSDAALYQAKSDGRGTFSYYSEMVTVRAKARIDRECDLRNALVEERLVVHYQPLISLGNGAMVGVEALVRMAADDGDLVPPDMFIPIAEENGMIVALGEFVLRSACTQMQAWVEAGLPLLSVSVNVSPRQFKNSGLLDSVRNILAETGLSPRCLELEITETGIIAAGGETVNLLQALKYIGIRLAIDDFGTGYSSLSRLRRFPIDRLKIDRQFVKDLGDVSGRRIVRAISGMAHSLGFDVVAEGVESEAQLRFLKRARCDIVQGYLFSRPIPADRVAGMSGERWVTRPDRCPHPLLASHRYSHLAGTVKLSARPLPREAGLGTVLHDDAS
ncbi:diguanylate cyclase [Azospirillaceae bacterium]